MTVLPASGRKFGAEVAVLIIGAGACGLVAALAAQEAGADPVVIERDPVPQGSTALSSGMIPAAGTRAQHAAGVDDDPDLMAADIRTKARGQADAGLVSALCRAAGPAVDWLNDSHGLGLTLVEGFLYPGHSRLRMHAPPTRAGADLMRGLTAAAERAGIDIVTHAQATELFADAQARVHGARILRPDGTSEMIGCKTLVLACNGFGGNPEMVRRYIPDMAQALYFGHPGNRGDAVVWGRALGAAMRHLGAYQGHGSVAHPHGVLLSWALMMEGGVQLNAEGLRFSNEHAGYSEQAREVLKQPGAIAWAVFDDRLGMFLEDFEDFRRLRALGAVRRAQTAAGLARLIGAPAANVEATLHEIRRLAATGGRDRFGRDFTAKPALGTPYFCVKTTGALFHTQGGLAVDSQAHVLDRKGARLPNLLAAGGAARGVSGPRDWGYLSGNGLLSAVALGRLAGNAAARMLR